ncbi:hypothetical protein BJD55_gp050 [Gordonia phage Yvonnetastic]|uniref:Cyclic-phosphate processing Receiver domain-containing protein n=1 Tax=Gordonia phage Yvonnetastic TaxID=1821566 RepID=A0A142K9D3_9CAUD|nr:hypothetical protein BJD55_gp050 [Gordonia phage Yvonnetastic]AMS02716.1 hypothetical protein SEA_YVONNETASTIC_172 [Gordonia phage Yvonnetastic]
MKLWVDDIRTPPEGWAWAKTSDEALWLIDVAAYSGRDFEAISLDHDLGGDDTTRPVVLWMAEHDHWPGRVHVHSSNPPGVEWLRGMVERYGPGVTLR